MANATIAGARFSELGGKRPFRWEERPSGHVFYVAMAIAFLVISVAGFAPSIVYPSHRLGSSSWLVAAHGSLFFVWLLVFLGQPILIKRRSYQTHRAVGIASSVLAVTMITVGYLTTIAATRRGFDFSGDLDLAHDPLGPINQMIFPLLDIAEFGVLVAAGYLMRRRSDYHKRLMLFATIAMLPAPFAHLIGHIPWLKPYGAVVLIPIFISLSASPIFDMITFRRVHPVSAWLAPSMFILDILCASVIGPSAIWTRIAQQLIQ